MCSTKNNSCCCCHVSIPLSIAGIVVSICAMVCASLVNFYTFGFVYGILFLLASVAYLVIKCRNMRKERQW